MGGLSTKKREATPTSKRALICTRKRSNLNVCLCNDQIAMAQYFFNSLGVEPRKHSYRAWDYVELPMREIELSGQIVEATLTFYLKMPIVPSNWAVGMNPTYRCSLVFIDTSSVTQTMTELSESLRTSLYHAFRDFENKTYVHRPTVCIVDIAPGNNTALDAVKQQALLASYCAEETETASIRFVPNVLDECIVALVKLEMELLAKDDENTL